MASFTDFMNEQKKKKKKEEEETSSFSDFMEEQRNKRKEEVAPVTKPEDIAPVTPQKEEKKEEKKGLFDGLLQPFDDGWDAGDLTSVILEGADRLVNNDFTSWLGTSAATGLASFNKGISSTADVLLGKPLQAIGWEDNPISSIADYYSDQYDAWKGDRAEAAEQLGGGTGWNIAGELIEGTMAAVPNLIAMIMTGGQSAAPTAVSLAKQAAMQAGNFLTKAGLTVETMMRNPQYWMSFARTLGIDYEEAKASGASDLTAAATSILSSLINSGIEIGLDGGSGVQGLAQDFANGNKNGFLAWVESTFEEGGEEVIQGFINNGIAKLTYDEDRELANLGDMAKEFGMGAGVGALLGGGVKVAQGVTNTAHSIQADKEREKARQKLTENEQKVIDKLVADKIAEAEKDGKKLTNAEKKKIRDSMITAMDEGTISTDVIEELFGGDTFNTFKTEKDGFFASDAYKSYNDTIVSERQQLKQLQEQLDALGKEPNTVENAKKYDSIQSQIEALKKSTKSAELKAQLDIEAKRINGIKQQLHGEVYELVKSDRLAQSYYELARKGLKYQADVSKYENEYARKTVQNIMDSGLGDGTRQFSKFVDLLARVSADKNMTFNLTNDKLLKGTEHDMSDIGARANAFVTDSGDVTLNMDSDKALNSLVGHEITHVLEGSEAYKTLSEFIKNYAIAKEGLEGYNKRIKKAEQLYKGKKNTTAEAEVVADLVGEYLFTDTDFIRKLSVENQGFFQKILDEIKYLCKVATGTKEARELERVKKAFLDIYNEHSEKVKTAKKTDTKVDTEANIDPENDADLDYESPKKYSVSVTDPNLIEFLENQEHITTYKAMVMIDGKLYPPMASKVKGEDGKYHMTNPRELGEWMQAEEDTTNIKFNDKGIGYYDLKKDDGGTVRAAYNPYEHSSNLVLNDQFEAAYKRDNLVTVECAIPVSEINSSYKAEYAKDGTGVMDWHSGVVAGKLTDNKRKVYLSRYLKAVRVLSDAETATKFKEIVGDTPVPFNVVSPGLLAELEKVGVNIDYDGSPQYQYLQRKAAENEAKKNAKYSISDSDGNQLSKEQQDFFKDSKVRDEDGNLKVMYHGTSKGGFTVFDTFGSNYGLFGAGSYFTDSKSIAESYTAKGKGKSPQVYKTYLNITNPMDMAAPADPDAWAEAFPDASFPESGTNEDFYRAMEEYFEDNYYPRWEAAEIAMDAIMGMGYDGITHIGGGRVNADGERHQVYIAFEAEQIKNTDNLNPTDDVDIRYSMSDSDGNKLTKEQADFFHDSKIVDKEGNLLKVYHTSDADFTVFDKSKKGEKTEAANTFLGFFFAESPDHMGQFPEFQNGTTKSFYLNMKKPMDLTNLSKEAFMDIVELTGGDRAEAAEIYDQELEAEKARAKLRGDNNTSLSISQLLYSMVGDYYHADFFDALKPNYDKLVAKGYDGVIDYLDEMMGEREFIVFDSNQAKLTSNMNPTADDDVRYSFSSIANSFFGKEEMSTSEFLMDDFHETEGYKNYVEECLNNLRQSKVDFDEDVEREAIRNAVDGIVRVAVAAKQAGYDIIDSSAQRDLRDSKKRLLFSSLEPNSDYFTSHDISTICDKRKNFAEIYDEIVRIEEAKGVPKGKRFFDNVDNYFAIHKIMADKGLTTPCRQCYVESMRKNLAPMAEAFLALVQETDPNNTANAQLFAKAKNDATEYVVGADGKRYAPKASNTAKRNFVLDAFEQHPEYPIRVEDLTIEMLTTAEGLAQLRIQAPLVYEAFNSFYGQAKPKMPKQATPFRFGELTALLTNENGKINKNLVDKINSTGGFRLQSYSDFQIQNYVDVLQVLFEAGTLGLNGHAYTKVPAFLDATEGTNLKRNISIFMYKDGDQWKLDRNDSFPYSLEEIYDIVNNDKTGSTSIIAVSQNADMSAWIMANDYVGYGIPFHKSGLKMGTVRDTNVKTDDGRVIKGYSGTIDHTKQQTEVWAKAGDGHKALTKVSKGINVYSFWDFDNKSNLSKHELIEKNVKAYIDQCEMMGYLPKFRNYVMNNGKVLNDVLKYSKELGFVSQDATIEDISFQYKGYTIPYGYYKFLGDFGMFAPDGKAAPQQTLSLENYNFDKAVEFFSDAESLRRTEILQQFANGDVRSELANSNMTTEELEELAKQKRTEVANEALAPVRNSISEIGEQPVEHGDYHIYGKDIGVQDEFGDFAPVADSSVTDVTDVTEETEDSIQTVKERLTAKLTNSQTELANVKKHREDSIKSFDAQIAKAQALLDSKKNNNTKVANNLKRRIEQLKRRKADVDAEYAKRISDIESKIAKTEAELTKDHTKQDSLTRAINRIDKMLEYDRTVLDEEFAQRRESLADKNSYISRRASELYDEIRNLKKGVRASATLGELLDTGYEWSSIKAALVNIKHTPGERVNAYSEAESLARELLNEDYENSLYNLDEDYRAEVKKLEDQAEKDRIEARKAHDRITRKDLHSGIMTGIRTTFAEHGFDFDEVMKNGKNLSTWSTVDNTPRRVMKKTFGAEAGGLLADLTVNRVAQNETEKIKWLNSYVDRKNGLLSQLSKQYHINPGSKEAAAVQMYGEGFYVNEKNEVIAYGDAELAKDFPDVRVQNNIKGLVNDPRIRQIYDDTLEAINESRVRNGYPEIPRLDNYYLHYRAQEDTFSRLGLPFNPNDIKAKDLPTDLNGVTVDLKPGQPYFASAMHRKGKQTSHDVFIGLERYLNAAANQIYHIDDIQTFRALRNELADTFGQANGLDGLDEMTEAEQQERIKEVFGSHLSTFAKFLNEEANVLAGKTALIDRAAEGIIGRRGLEFLNTVNRQVGSNAVGYSVSSAIVNLDAIPRAFAKSNKADMVKAFGQMVYNTVSRRNDGFSESSPVIIRRKGSDRFYRNLWQKLSDPGYVAMGAVDNFATELIARTKYNELTRKGMDSQQAHFETDKWVSDLMGDRSLGQMPQIYNSKMLGLVTKFQLEVRNNLDSMFYDSIQDAKASTKDIEDGLAKNAKTAAKATWTIFQLAVAQHIFGKAFEAIAGYNPSFDIIEAIIKAFGWDDEEDSEDTALDNIEQAFHAVLEDLPYASTFTGGRIPINNALPIEELIMGTDKYGNEKSRLETLAEVAPYYLLPGGYGQIKKTIQGLGMFSDDHPITGSFTDNGAMRFPVDKNFGNILQVGLFGQYASSNARDYFDNDYAPLAEKQIQEFIDVGMSIQDYWKYRKGLSGLSTLAEKADYIDSLDLTDEQKNILINNIADRDEDIDMSGYGNYGSFEEFDFAQKNPDKYQFFNDVGISWADYSSADKDKKSEYSDMYNWVDKNPGKYTMSKAVSNDFLTYWQYKSDLGDLKADKDKYGETISGSKKQKAVDYINGLPLDYGQKIIMFRSMYDSKEDRDYYNADILEYLNSRTDLTFEEIATILTELGFTVYSDGRVTWD